MKKNEIVPTDNIAKHEAVNNDISRNYAPLSVRYEMGKQMRKNCPRSSHAKWEAPKNRHDPVDLILESNNGRIQR